MGRDPQASGVIEGDVVATGSHSDDGVMPVCRIHAGGIGICAAAGLGGIDTSLLDTAGRNGVRDLPGDTGQLGHREVNSGGVSPRCDSEGCGVGLSGRVSVPGRRVRTALIVDGGRVGAGRDASEHVRSRAAGTVHGAGIAAVGVVKIDTRPGERSAGHAVRNIALHPAGVWYRGLYGELEQGFGGDRDWRELLRQGCSFHDHERLDRGRS